MRHNTPQECKFTAAIFSLFCLQPKIINYIYLAVQTVPAATEHPNKSPHSVILNESC